MQERNVADILRDGSRLLDKYLFEPTEDGKAELKKLVSIMWDISCGTRVTKRNPLKDIYHGPV